MGNDLSLGKILGIETIETKPKPVPTVIENNQDDHITADYELSRATYRELIQNGKDALAGISQLADASDSPRAYEVLATLIKTISETTKDLYDLQKKSKEIKDYTKEKRIDESTINVDKAVFVGSTAELLAQLKNKEKTE